MIELIWQIIQPMFVELVMLAGAVGVILGLVRKGRNDQRRDDELRRAKETVEAHKRMDKADETTPSDPDVLRDWLRERSKRSGGL